MNDSIKKARSPSCPQISLQKAVELVRHLHAKAGKASISRETALGPLGFPSMHGTALTTLSALGQYGLINSEYGAGLRVSDLAIKLIHPINPDQEKELKGQAALNPKVFSELFNGGYSDCDEGVLKNHLIQSGFTPDAAKKVASVFRSNLEFANLKGPEPIMHDSEDPDNASNDSTGDVISSAETKTPEPADPFKSRYTPRPPFASRPHEIAASETSKVLAQYTIPLGANEATLVFRGEALLADDFDALIDFVAFSKRQFERAQSFSQKFRDTPPALRAIHVHDGGETLVHVVPTGTRDGEKVYRDQAGSEYLESELILPL